MNGSMNGRFFWNLEGVDPGIPGLFHPSATLYREGRRIVVVLRSEDDWGVVLQDYDDETILKVDSSSGESLGEAVARAEARAARRD